jgi:hypothetical protein
LIVFHIGIHKTGSSTLQALLAANVARLAERGIVVPLQGERAGPHHALAHAIGGDDADAGAAWRDLMRQMAGRGAGERWVLSSEAFCNVDPVAVRAAIGDVAVRVVAYVREPCAWLTSLYAQVAKSGQIVADFDAYFDERAERARGKGILAWARVFGGESLRVRSVAPGCLVNGDLVDDFLAALGTTREGLVVPPVMNVAPDWRVVEMMRARHLAARAEAGRVLDRHDPVCVAIRACGLAAGEELGWSTRAGYMTRAQRERYVEECRPVDAAIRAAVPDCRIEPTDAAVAGERDWLPTVERVSEEDQRAFDSAFARRMAARLAQEERRRARPRATGAR